MPLHTAPTTRVSSIASVVTLLVAAVVAAGPWRAATLAQSPDDRAVIARLGPDGFAGVPPLGMLVDGSEAAVVARVVGTKPLTLREVANPYSGHHGVVAYAGYRIAIDDVLFTRQPPGTAALTPGSEIELGMEVGRDSAERFAARRIPVAAGDTCLLFLFARPHGWTLLGWHVQFRRADGPPPTAESLGGARFAYAITPEWLGAGVEMLPTARGVAPAWASLLAEVRRLGAAPRNRRPDR